MSAESPDTPEHLVQYLVKARGIVDSAIASKGQGTNGLKSMFGRAPQTFEQQLVPQLWESYVEGSLRHIDEGDIEPEAIDEAVRNQLAVNLAASLHSHEQAD